MSKRADKKQVNKKVDLAVFLPQFTDCLYENSVNELTVNYYNLHELSEDYENSFSNGENEVITKLSDAVYEVITEKRTDDEIIQSLNELRNQVISRVETVVAYTDRFTLYEYILNRIELRFHDKADEIDVEDTSREIMSALFASTDNGVINSNLQLMVSQLPIRMTRNKFFTLIEDGMASYNGAECDTVDKFMYLVKSSAGLYMPDGFESFSDELAAADMSLRNIDYKEMSKAEFDEMRDVLDRATEYLNEASDFYLNIQQVINPLTAYCILKPYASANVISSVNDCMELLEFMSESFAAENRGVVSEELLKCFSNMEGRPEQLSMEITKYSGMLEGLTEQQEAEAADMDMGELLDGLEKCTILLSSSTFAKTDNSEEFEIADEEYVNKKADELKKELGEVFDNNKQMYNRAVMASVLKELPVFFNNKSEVMEYIKNSLEQCRDKYEKNISIELLLSNLE